MVFPLAAAQMKVLKHLSLWEALRIEYAHTDTLLLHFRHLVKFSGESPHNVQKE